MKQNGNSQKCKNCMALGLNIHRSWKPTHFWTQNGQSVLQENRANWDWKVWKNRMMTTQCTWLCCEQVLKLKTKKNNIKTQNFWNLKLKNNSDYISKINKSDILPIGHAKIMRVAGSTDTVFMDDIIIKKVSFYLIIYLNLYIRLIWTYKEPVS